MTTHPYLRAYMAGVTVPAFLMLFVFTFFCTVRFVFDAPYPVERVIVFPLALVPNAWGLWNILYVRFGGGRRWALGVHGAALPLLLGPAGFVIAHLAGAPVPEPLWTLMAAGFPLILIGYYLAWKFLVGYLNDMLGIA